MVIWWYETKVGLCCALIARSRLTHIDETTTGVDPAFKKNVQFCATN